MRIHDPGQFTRSRLERLLDRLAGALPQATAASLIEGAMGYCSVTLRFETGHQVLLSVDADLPEVLFEVVRFVTPAEPVRHPFERRSTLGAAYTDKLSGDAAMEILRAYSSLAALPPSIGTLPPASK